MQKKKMGRVSGSNTRVEAPSRTARVRENNVRIIRLFPDGKTKKHYCSHDGFRSAASVHRASSVLFITIHAVGAKHLHDVFESTMNRACRGTALEIELPEFHQRTIDSVLLLIATGASVSVACRMVVLLLQVGKKNGGNNAQTRFSTVCVECHACQHHHGHHRHRPCRCKR